MHQLSYSIVIKFDVHGTITDSSESELIASRVHVLSTIGLFADMQSAEDVPGVAPPTH